MAQAPILGSELQKQLNGKPVGAENELKNDSGCPKLGGFPKSGQQQAREKFTPP